MPNKAHRLLQSTIDSITDGLLVMDGEWRYTYFSEQVARNVDVQQQDMLGLVWDLLPHANRTRFYGVLTGYRLAGETGSQIVFSYTQAAAPLSLYCSAYGNIRLCAFPLLGDNLALWLRHNFGMLMLVINYGYSG